MTARVRFRASTARLNAAHREQTAPTNTCSHATEKRKTYFVHVAKSSFGVGWDPSLMRLVRFALFLVVVAVLAVWIGDARAAVRSSFSLPSPAPPSAQGTLRVESDADDSILIVCVGGRVLINGAPPDTGPLECSRATRIDVHGGPGDNRIDLGGIAPAQANGVLKGVAAHASLTGGAGDDVVIGPSGGLVTLDGGPGSDQLREERSTPMSSPPPTRPSTTRSSNRRTRAALPPTSGPMRSACPTGPSPGTRSTSALSPRTTP